METIFKTLKQNKNKPGSPRAEKYSYCKNILLDGLKNFSFEMSEERNSTPEDPQEMPLSREQKEKLEKNEQSLREL